jgi:hypothetical protein
MQCIIYYLKKNRLIDSNADKEAVVKKINAFRTNYRREKLAVTCVATLRLLTSQL